MDLKDILACSTDIAHNEMLFLTDEHNTEVGFCVGDTGRLDYLMDQRST